MRRQHLPESLLRHLAKSRPALETLEVGSAGTIALSGNLPSADAVDVMRRQFGLEIATHRARPLTRSLTVDLVLTLDRETEREAQALKLRAPVTMLGDYVGTGEEVEDPYGRTLRHYREVALQLNRLVERVVARLDSGVVPTPEI